jgi:large-conductance mechanosensitive channel
MIVLFLYGLCGLKIALIAWVIYLIAKKMTQRGEEIKRGYEERIEELEEENRQLRLKHLRDRRKREALPPPQFPQPPGSA